MQRWTSEPLTFEQYSDGGFSRADLEFESLEHDGGSFTVALYLNTSDDAGSSPDAQFTVFGHGDCWGDKGHCHVPEPASPFDRRAPHALEPINITVEITEALARVQAADEVVVTALAHGADPDATDLLRFARLTLAVYE